MCSFLCRQERLFLLLETVLGREGCVVVISTGPVRFSRRGKGLGGRRLLLVAAEPAASPCLPGPRNLSLHSATRAPAATFLGKDHTCAYSRFGGEVSWKTGESSVPRVLSWSPISELTRKCCFHLLIAPGTSILGPRQVVVYTSAGIFSSLWTRTRPTSS